MCRKCAHDDAGHDMREALSDLVDRVAFHYKRAKLAPTVRSRTTPSSATLANINLPLEPLRDPVITRIAP